MWHRAVDTHWLTHAGFRLTAPHWGWRHWTLAAATAVLLLIVAGRGFVGDLLMTSVDLAAARARQAALVAEVERLNTQLAVEGATRSELEQHAAELNAQVEELTRQLEFLTERRLADARTN